jgi:hypothetical protein
MREELDSSESFEYFLAIFWQDDLTSDFLPSLPANPIPSG